MSRNDNQSQPTAGGAAMFNHTDMLVLRERQRDLQREARRQQLAKQALSRNRQTRKDNRRLARVLSLFL
jgi:hypothetical protein